jgi:hypothetical protein
MVRSSLARARLGRARLSEGSVQQPSDVNSALPGLTTGVRVGTELVAEVEANELDGFVAPDVLVNLSALANRLIYEPSWKMPFPPQVCFPDPAQLKLH